VQTRKHLLGLSLTAFDPKPTFGTALSARASWHEINPYDLIAGVNPWMPDGG
jgi:hypothetical protein